MTDKAFTPCESELRRSPIRTMKTGWLIFALVMIFNPNVNIIDFLPDFIGFFILAKFFERAADAAPYFDEAKKAFTRLCIISSAKLPALLIVTMIRSANTLDNDVVALMALVFAALELIYVIPAINNTFAALSYLGERSGARSLIRDDTVISTESLRSLTLTFAVMKCLFYTLPEFLRLTRSVDEGSTTSMLTGSRFYPWAVMASLILGFILGGVWLSRMRKYVKSIRTEGCFFSALEAMASEGSYAEFEKRIRERSIRRYFLIFVLAAALSVDLSFSNLNEINLLPSFIFGILFTISLAGIAKQCSEAKINVRTSSVLGTIYCSASLVKYVFEVIFLSDYGYSALLDGKNIAALQQYRIIEIFSVIEGSLYIALIALFYVTMKKFCCEKLIRRAHDDAQRSAYYYELRRKTLTLSAIGLISGLVSIINVFLNGDVKLIFTNANDVTMPTMVVSSLPWFGLVVTVFTIAYVFYSVYYFNLIKDELEK